MYQISQEAAQNLIWNGASTVMRNNLALDIFHELVLDLRFSNAERKQSRGPHIKTRSMLTLGFILLKNASNIQEHITYILFHTSTFSSYR